MSPRLLAAQRSVHCLNTTHYIMRDVTACTLHSALRKRYRLDEQYPLTSPRHFAAQFGVPCLYTTHCTTVEITTRRAVSTDITPSPRGLARCNCLYTTQCTTEEISTRRAVSTDVTPTLRGSVRSPLLIHYTLHHGRDND
ncbi:hypothetical protein J6590_085233 [Homalodisca vitripennis]|nr:hypothetical protein J6590_085233 [Homalodisca vitripennis]